MYSANSPIEGRMMTVQKQFTFCRNFLCRPWRRALAARCEDSNFDLGQSFSTLRPLFLHSMLGGRMLSGRAYLEVVQEKKLLSLQ